MSTPPKFNKNDPAYLGCLTPSVLRLEQQSGNKTSIIEGAQGPAGPRGPQGIPGPEGPQGEPGDTTAADAAAAAAAESAAEAAASAEAAEEDAAEALAGVALKAPLASPEFTGELQQQIEVLRYDLAAGYQLLHPTKQSVVGFDISHVTPIGTPRWTKIAEWVCATNDASGFNCDFDVLVENRIGSVGLTVNKYTASIRVTGPQTFGNAIMSFVGGSYAASYYPRAYRYVDGLGRICYAVYLFDSLANNDKVWSGVMRLRAGNAADIVTVWQNGDVPTDIDPTTTLAATEITRTWGIGGVAVVPDANLYLNTAGGVSDPAKATQVANAGTTYALLPTDHNKKIYFSAATQITVTVDTGVLTPGFYCEFVQSGSGQVVVQAGAGMTQATAGTAKTRALYSPLALEGRTNVLYYVSGDMSAT